MSARPINEFNITGAPSEELRRKLLYLAMTDNGSVMTGLRPPGGHAAANAREGDSAYRYMSMMMEMATADEVQRLQDKLDRLEQATIEALQENEERLREATEELERIREAAMTLTMPDGTVRRVYRDGDRVRFEDGTQVDAEIIRAESVSDNPLQWSELQALEDAVTGFSKQREDLLQLHEDIDEAQDRVQRGDLTKEDVDDIDSALNEATPDAVLQYLDGAADSPAPVARQQDAATGPQPTDDRPQVAPSSSMPAPG